MMTLKRISSKFSHNFLSYVLFAEVASFSLVGCISTRVVGENDPEAENQNTVTEQTGDGTDCEFPPSAEPACASRDGSADSGHRAWACSPNELGALAGTEWRLTAGSWSSVSAYIGNTLTLRFGADGKSTFEVGTPVAPVAEIGHLCSDRMGEKDYCSLSWGQRFPVGAVYPLHGISQTDDGWTLSFRSASYLNEWCGLQTPREEFECSFNLIGHNGFLFGPACESADECNVTFDGPDGGLYGTTCSLGNFDNEVNGLYHVVEEKDCRWLMLAGRLGESCGCTSSYCFSSSAGQSEWRLALAEDGETLMLEADLPFSDEVEEQTFRRVH